MRTGPKMGAGRKRGAVIVQHEREGRKETRGGERDEGDERGYNVGKRERGGGRSGKREDERNEERWMMDDGCTGSRIILLPHPKLTSCAIHYPSSSIFHHPSLSILHYQFFIIYRPSSQFHHPSYIIHHVSSIIHHPSSIINHP